MAWAAFASHTCATSESDFLPGHRVGRAYFEDSPVQGSVGAGLGWAMRWNDELVVTPFTDLSLTKLHQRPGYMSMWGVGIRLAGTTTVTPFIELGVSFGEGFGEILGDHVFGDREANWVDTDGFSATGLEFNTGFHWRTNIYYRTFSRRGKGVEVEHSEGMGVGVTYRFARVRPLWWKVPISPRSRN